MEDFFEENVVADPNTGSALAEEKKFLTESIVEGIEDCEGVWSGFQSADYLLAGKDVVLKHLLNAPASVKMVAATAVNRNARGTQILQYRNF
jgi:hypothetical protein